MLIGLMTDTHENIENIKKSVEIFNEKGVSLVLHCGDIISPITYSAFKDLKCNIRFVFGNNDGERPFLISRFKGLGEFFNNGYKFELAGKKFIMMHEPIGIDELAESKHYDYVLYGHTHKQDIRDINGTKIINIGETSGIMNGKGTIGVLEVETGKLEVISL